MDCRTGAYPSSPATARWVQVEPRFDFKPMCRQDMVSVAFVALCLKSPGCCQTEHRDGGLSSVKFVVTLDIRVCSQIDRLQSLR